MVDDAFPSQEIIDEFLQDPGPVTSLRLDWCQPNVVKFVVSALTIPESSHTKPCYQSDVVQFTENDEFNAPVGRDL